MAHRIELLTGSVANANAGSDYSVRLRAIVRNYAITWFLVRLL